MKPEHQIHHFDGGSYFDETRRAMALLASNQNTLFIGQCISYESNALYRTLENRDGSAIVPFDRRIELPVAEDMQGGIAIGLALAGYLPISIYPRFDFLLLAANSIVNHLDKMRAKVIVRTTVGASFPFSSGVQQSGDYSAAFRLMLKNVEVIELNSRFDVFKGYQRALAMNGSCIVVERQDLYNV